MSCVVYPQSESTLELRINDAVNTACTPDAFLFASSTVILLDPCRSEEADEHAYQSINGQQRQHRHFRGWGRRGGRGAKCRSRARSTFMPVPALLPAASPHPVLHKR